MTPSQSRRHVGLAVLALAATIACMVYATEWTRVFPGPTQRHYANLQTQIVALCQHNETAQLLVGADRECAVIACPHDDDAPPPTELNSTARIASREITSALNELIFRMPVIWQSVLDPANAQRGLTGMHIQSLLSQGVSRLDHYLLADVMGNASVSARREAACTRAVKEACKRTEDLESVVHETSTRSRAATCKAAADARADIAAEAAAAVYTKLPCMAGGVCFVSTYICLYIVFAIIRKFNVQRVPQVLGTSEEGAGTYNHPAPLAQTQQQQSYEIGFGEPVTTTTTAQQASSEEAFEAAWGVAASSGGFSSSSFAPPAAALLQNGASRNPAQARQRYR